MVEGEVDRVAGAQATAYLRRADAEHHLHRRHAADDVVVGERQPADSGLDCLDEAAAVKDALRAGLLNFGGVASSQSANNKRDR